jgi:serpin B
LLALCVPAIALGAADNPLASANNAFALDLYGQLRAQDGNLFFSPYSISTALAMIYAGARGETAAQMAKVLYFQDPPKRILAGFNLLETRMNQTRLPGQTADSRWWVRLLGGRSDNVWSKARATLTIANSLWPHKKYGLLPDYRELCEKRCGATIVPLDYATAPEDSCKTINNWVEHKTNGKITSAIQPDAVGALTRLVLVNVIYFKGTWAKQFEHTATRNEPFHIAATKTVEVPMMHGGWHFRYAENGELQMLDLPYRGDDFSMIVLLPRKRDGLADLEAKLTIPNLTAWIANLRERSVEVVFPKFKITAQFGLGDKLAALGMTDAFTDKADFSGMDGQRDLYLNHVIHRTFVNVDEEGTEATALNIIWIVAGIETAPPPVFRADHPFLFLIRDNHSGSILFLGRVTDPTK